MLASLNALIIDCSRSWWKFLIVLLVQTASLQVLQRISNEFPSVAGGAPPFDMQNALTAEEVFRQLEGYTEQAFDLYAVFQAVDFVFPIFAAFLIASVSAFALRNLSEKFYGVAQAKSLFVILLLPALFDYLENIFFLWTVNAWPNQVQIAADLAVASKMGKLTTMGMAFVIAILLLLGAAGAWVMHRAGTVDHSGDDDG